MEIPAMLEAIPCFRVIVAPLFTGAEGIVKLYRS